MPIDWDIANAKFYPPAFVELARKATALRPYDARNWIMLANNLFRTGQDEEAIAVLIEAVSKLPSEPKLYLTLADAYHRTRRSDRACEVLAAAPPIPGDDRSTTIGRLELLMKTHAAKDASRFAADALALDPANAAAIKCLARAAREQGTPEIMVPVCEAALEHEPGHVQARYELAAAFAMLGNSDAARRLIDLDKFVTVTDVPAPAGYADAAAFEAALADEILRDPTLQRDPVNHATKDGFHSTDGLPHPGQRAVAVLLDRVRLAVDAVEAGLADRRDDDAFCTIRPKRARLDAWSLVQPSDGHQMPHIHPDGWLSGVYYVSVPKTFGDDPRAGCLVLGSLPVPHADMVPPWGLRDIEPVPGRLVMFPSYVPHSTTPTGSPEPRICVAFDVVPRKSDTELVDQEPHTSAIRLTA